MLTDQGVGVDPVFAAPIGSNNVTVHGTSGSSLTIAATMGDTSPSFGITLPTAGTWLISGFIRPSITGNGTLGQYVYITTQLYDVTNSAIVPNSANLLIQGSLQVASTNVPFQQSATVGPVIYTVSGSTVINLQALAAGTATVASSLFTANFGGVPTLVACALRDV